MVFVQLTPIGWLFGGVRCNNIALKSATNYSIDRNEPLNICMIQVLRRAFVAFQMHTKWIIFLLFFPFLFLSVRSSVFRLLERIEKIHTVACSCRLVSIYACIPITVCFRCVGKFPQRKTKMCNISCYLLSWVHLVASCYAMLFPKATVFPFKIC